MQSELCYAHATRVRLNAQGQVVCAHVCGRKAQHKSAHVCMECKAQWENAGREDVLRKAYSGNKRMTNARWTTVTADIASGWVTEESALYKQLEAGDILLQYASFGNVEYAVNAGLLRVKYARESMLAELSALGTAVAQELNDAREIWGNSVLLITTSEYAYIADITEY